MIRRGPPHRLVPLSIGTRLQEVPGPLGRVPVDRNEGTDNMVEGKADALTRPAEKLPNGFPSLVVAE